MSSALGPRVSKIVAVGLLVTLILFVVFYLIMPVVDMHREADGRLELAREMIERLSTGVVDPEMQAARLDKLIAQIAASGDYLTATNWSLASVELTDIVEGAVRKNGAQLQSRQILGDGEEKDPEMVLRVALTADIKSLYRIFYSLEARKPLLFIRDLNLQAQASSHTSDSEPIALKVQFSVVAYLPPGQTR